MKKALFLLLAVAALMAAPKKADAQVAIGGTGFGFFETGNTIGDPAMNRAAGISLGASYYQHVGNAAAVSAGLSYRFVLDPNPKGNEHGVELPLAFNYFFGASKDFVPFVSEGPDDSIIPFVYAGPTLEFGLGGSVPGAKRFDVQNRFNVLVGAGAGIYLVDNYIILKLGYDYSLMDYSISDADKQTRHYIRLGVSFVL